ncbi:hypothetical protein H6769_05750 [Candidatus Peribacteria bacterium]|nr:hypothetical protein [Candidatus Peribacteria bacterium]
MTTTIKRIQEAISVFNIRICFENKKRGCLSYLMSISPEILELLIATSPEMLVFGFEVTTE